MADGDELLRRIGRAAEAIDPAFTDRDVQRLVAGAGRRARRRKLRRVALAGLGGGAAALLLALRFGGLTPAPVPVAFTRAPCRSRRRLLRSRRRILSTRRRSGSPTDPWRRRSTPAARWR